MKFPDNPQILITAADVDRIMSELCDAVIASGFEAATDIVVGLRPRGVYVSDRLVDLLGKKLSADITYGKLDISFYRDDVRQEIRVPETTEMNFEIEGKKVLLIDDVLYTGRTIRAALDALQDFGRPGKIQLLALVNRLADRELPIQPDFSGLIVQEKMNKKVKVDYEKGHVFLY